LPFEEWEKTAGVGFSGDPLWSVQAYRRAQYAVDVHTHDRRSISQLVSARIELGPVVDERQALLIQIRRLLLTTLRNMRLSDPTAMLTDFRRKK
jgi:hypothetical protein